MIVNITQCIQGMVEMGLYAASSGLLDRGVISALDVTPEAVMTKLMCSQKTRIGPLLVSHMQVSQRGEMTENLFDLRYGGCGKSSAAESEFHQFQTPLKLETERLSRTTVRFTGLGVHGEKTGDWTSVRVFMNHPTAKATTSHTHERCVAELKVQVGSDPINVAVLIEDAKLKNAIGDGEITLSVVSDPGVKFWFEGLFLAVFAHA